MRREAHGVVGEACDNSAMKKAPTVAMLLVDDESDRDGLFVHFREDWSPRVGDPAVTVVGFKTGWDGVGSLVLTHGLPGEDLRCGAGVDVRAGKYHSDASSVGPTLCIGDRCRKR